MIREKVTKWIVYSAILSLAPILFYTIKLLGHGEAITFDKVLGHGELLLITAILSAAAIGEIVASGENWKIWKLISGGGCLLIVILASAWYADILMAASVPANTLSSENIAKGSMMMFGFGIITSLSCVILSELE